MEVAKRGLILAFLPHSEKYLVQTMESESPIEMSTWKGFTPTVGLSVLVSDDNEIIMEDPYIKEVFEHNRIYTS